MTVIGIICEYNPFHNGHDYFIKKIKHKYPDSLIITIINGYFLERGEISIISKENKTNIALNMGSNIVIELPVFFGTQSADTFANAAIYLLNILKVDKIIFGSESNNLNNLENIATKQLNTDYSKELKNYLKEGINYPTALNKTLKNNIKQPNDLLGISYIKAIKLLNPSISYEIIKRTNEYHDIKSNNKIISASNIRNKIKNNIKINKYIPNIVMNYIENINYDIFFNLIKYKILTDNHLSDYLSVDEGIENKLKKEIINSQSLDDFIMKIKTKRYTYNRLNRMLIHILIGITKEDRKKINFPTYLKILGFDKNGQKYLNSIKKVINLLKPNNKDIIYNYELKALEIYNLIIQKNYNYDRINKPIKK